MKHKTVQYRESHKLSPNGVLFFYGYVTVLMMLANIVPVSATSYCIFFILGIAGCCILFVRAAYTITVHNNILVVSIKFFVTIVVQKLDLQQTERVEEYHADNAESTFTIKKSPRGVASLIKIPTSVKIIMQGKKSYIIATVNPASLIQLTRSLNK